MSQDIKKNVIKQIACQYGFSLKTANEIYSDVISGVIDMIISGEANISGVGCFHVVDRKERVGRNPRTGEEIKISAKKTVKFTPSKLIKEQINK